MSSDNTDNTRDKAPVRGGFLHWLRRRIIPIAGLVLVLGIMAAILYLKYSHPEILDELENYGYLGAFIVSIIFNATLILPAGNMLIQMTLGATTLSPVLLGLASGAGATIGEITGDVAGRSGRGLITKSKMYGRVEIWVKKWGVLTIFVFSIVPLVFDLVGIAAGALRVPFWKFFIACMLGRILLYITMIWLVSLGFDWIIEWLD
jgi:membrane protein YqaA with SNARE-associated domain